MKKLLTIAMITLAAVAAKADLYLYWTADVGEFTSATAAQLYGQGENDTYSLIETVMLGANGAMNVSSADLGVTTYTSYFVKLYEGALENLNEIAQSSSSVSYGDSLASHVWNTAEAGSKPPSDPYTFSGFTATIPEPTSAFMLLLGLAGLALKRKHV